MKVKIGQRFWICHRLVQDLNEKLLEENKDSSYGFYFSNTKRYLKENCGLVLHFCHYKKGVKFKNKFYWRAEIIDLEKYMLAKISYGF